MNKNKVVDGFMLGSEKEYHIALKEWDTIKNLETKLDLNNSKILLELYVKAVSNSSFNTIVGKFFLKKIRDRIIDNGIMKEENLPPIETPEEYVAEGVKIYYKTKYKTMYKNDELRQNQIEKLKASVVRLRMGLVIFGITIVVMFFVVINSKSINYNKAKESLLDSYSNWEEELKLREQNVKELEQQYGTDSEKENK